ncbi:glutathione transport system ATP-binding protein [Azorhizobium sp. AG788]|uniref:ABC transporter ATP-binding protein n=1 Tax=Azorhizobium sp. AG788 TaxID=2183897 RepID=UPI00105E8341|nr:dipeptide ABC transporter ATP-binding protein [Azorhizobium sp. AG788]TDT93448.1 glutathione transport system ATP-binding protein [Azorhizobium sp. AG788]
MTVTPLSAAPTSAAASALVRVEGLCVDFPGEDGTFRAVDDLSFHINPGETLAVVGESGSGKSVTSLSLMRLVEFGGGRISSGALHFRGRDGQVRDLAKLPLPAMNAVRGNEIAMIFQEPMTSLNPVFTIGEQIAEAVRLHQGASRAAARAEALAMLEKVRIPGAKSLLDRHPHQLSGGMRQRVMIAMALACRPKLLVADEPTTALDVTIQAQILRLIRILQDEMGMAVLFITHDMGVVAEVADRVLVMRHGRKVEEGISEEVFAKPQHPYTRALLSAVPRLGALAGEPLPRRFPLVVLNDAGGSAYTEAPPQDTVEGDTPVLEVKNLVTRFDVRKGMFGRLSGRVHAVEQVNFNVKGGETLALVGESGCGKSTTGRTIMQLQEATSGEILFHGRNLLAMGAEERRRIRQKIQYVFQDPFASLDPRLTVGFSIAEPLTTHGLAKGREVEERVADLLRDVGLSPEHARRYPHEFSGGQRQRICIARALASEPELLIADEAVAALDVSIQAQIVNLLMELQEKRRLSYIFISHDMAVVERVSHRVAVMYLGQIVEIGPRQAVFDRPAHPYTRRLMAAVPIADPARRDRARPLLEGEIPSAVRALGDLPVVEPLVEVGEGHFVARHPIGDFS